MFLGLRFGVRDDQKAAAARDSSGRRLDRLDGRARRADYLVGDSFTVADLTAASLFYPLVTPPEAPAVAADLGAGWEEFRRRLRQRPARLRWVRRCSPGTATGAPRLATSPRCPARP